MMSRRCSTTPCLTGHPGRHVQRHLLAALHLRRLLRAAADGSAAATAVAAILDAAARRPSRLRLPHGRNFPGRHRRTVPRRRRSRGGRAGSSGLQPEVWHGITIPLLMSLAALVGGALLYLVLR